MNGHKLRSVIGVAQITTLCEVVLVLMLAFLCSQYVWNLAAPGGANGEGATDYLRQNEAGSRLALNPPDLSLLSKANPFLVRETNRVLVDTEALDAPETSLDLVLKGVRTSAEGARPGVAFILGPDNSVVRAETGFEILDDVLIESIFSDRVILRRGASLEALYLRDPDRRESGISAATVTTTSVEPDTIVRHSDITAAEFLAGIALERVDAEDLRAGYQITSLGQTARSTKTGFEAGDIIVAVNGRDALNMDVEGLRAEVLQSQRVIFDVDRAGEPMKISIRFFQGASK